MMELLFTILCGVAALITLLFLFLRYRLHYWKQRQIPHDEPKMFLGNMRANTHIAVPMNDLYKKYKGTGPFCGFYFYMAPSAMLLDQELIKKVLIKDFNNFNARGFYNNEANDPLSAHLFAIDGPNWRKLRIKFTPTFTSNKMKFMFPAVVDISNRLAKTLNETIGKNRSEIVDIQELSGRFTTDVIGTCAFGLECNSLQDPNAEFRNYGRLVLEESNHHPLIMGFIQSCPELARKLGLRITRRDVEKFFIGAVRSTVEYREKNNIQMNDFMSLLIDLKNNKPIPTEDGQLVRTGLTMEEVAAQAFLFWVAGFETSSATMAFTIYELARHIDVQDKLRQSIEEALQKHNGELNYESLKEMHYLDQVFDETLRLYPVVPFLQRVAAEDYTSSTDKNYKIEKGTMIIIPVQAIHNDPEIYPNPSEYDPERFSAEEKLNRESCAYLPFGEGPRNCIGMRFGKMQVKMGVVLLIKNFKFSFCEETPKKINVDPAQFALASFDKVFLKVEKV